MVNGNTRSATSRANVDYLSDFVNTLKLMLQLQSHVAQTEFIFPSPAPRGFNGNGEDHEYKCWSCAEGFHDKIEFLWHIDECCNHA